MRKLLSFLIWASCCTARKVTGTMLIMLLFSDVFKLKFQSLDFPKAQKKTQNLGNSRRFDFWVAPPTSLTQGKNKIFKGEFLIKLL